jgi:UDP-glucose 4-epimerase
VAAAVAAAAGGTGFRISGDGRQTRDFVYVDDAVDALIRAGTRGSGLVVNVGTGEQTTIREVWERLRRPNSPAPVAGPPDDLPRFAVSPVRARIHLGWSPWTTLDQGLAALE